MAEKDENEGGLSPDEAKEVEDLLEESEEGEEKPLKGLIPRILGDKKLRLMVGGGALVLILLLGGGLFSLFSGEEAEVEEAVLEPEEPIERQILPKVYVYTLKPFFMALRLNDEETGKFLTITPNLLLSNQLLHREIDKILPLVRKNIYNILRRKTPRDYIEKQSKLEVRIKREIIIASNALLLSGTGTIQDVLITQFVVK